MLLICQVEKKEISYCSRSCFGSKRMGFLDEPYIGLNQELIKTIHSNLKNNKQLSIMLVTHNLRMLKPQDKVIFFSDIASPEIGTHSQLLNSSEMYRNYYKSQMNGDINV